MFSATSGELVNILQEQFACLTDQRGLLVQSMAEFEMTWHDRPIKQWHDDWHKWAMENPGVNPCNCGNWQLHFGLTLLAPMQMSRFSDQPKKQKAAGNYVEGLLMYIYERGSDSREHRWLFYGLIYFLTCLQRYWSLQDDNAYMVFIEKCSWTFSAFEAHAVA